MAELNTAEELDDINELEYGTDALTGGQDKRMYLYYQLLNSLKRADSVDIVVSFLMESGVRMLLGELDNALKRGAKIRILTGNYLGITQPSALYLIKHKLGEQVDLRFYNEKNRSFHPKSYMFHYKDYSTIYIGSSNISKSALTSGIEWNYRFSSKTDSHNYEKFYNTFLDLFEHHSIVIDDDELKRYSKNWHRPAVSKDLDRYDLQDDETTNNLALFEPRGAQIEALCALENTRAEGAGRALVQAATGVGKTYLAAFDSKDYERVLFVAHREEILKQAAQSFKNVRNSDDYGFFDGESKCTDKSMIFASVATLGRSEYLNNKYFASDYFNYIVIDEFHHAVNDQYQRIVNYFKPQFLLGLTATPERMDGRNIYEICDYNVPYEISLKEAINKGMLVPFHYYGIFDDTDYSKLHIVRGRYDEKELNETYIGNVHRYELIYKYYCKYGSRQALGFCCSKEHAREMAREFSSRGIPSVAVFSDASGEYTEKRNVAIQKLKNGEIRAIFSVDMFNEGVRPSVDSGLSVSRVGSAAQTKAMKQVSGSLKLELAQYREMESFAKFGSDLDASTKDVLDHGARLTQLLIQKQYSPLTVPEQVLSLYAAKNRYLKPVEVDHVGEFEQGMLEYAHREYPYVLDQIEMKKAIDDELEADIKKALDAYAKQYALEKGAQHGTE